MNIYVLSFADFYKTMNVFITNTINNKTISNSMALIGYDSIRLQEGQGLLDTLWEADSMQIEARAVKITATESVQKATAVSDHIYKLHRLLMKRILAGNKPAQAEFLLHEHRPRRRADWIRQASIFYTRLLDSPDMMVEMAAFGQTVEKVEEGKTAVNHVITLDGIQQKAIADAQSATRQRTEAWAAARQWMSTAVKLAPFALSDNPQLMESLGIVVPS